MVTYNHPTAPLSSFNHALITQIRTRGAPKRVLENVLKLVAEIKKQNLRLDKTSYNALLSAYSRAREYHSMMNVFEEMKEANIEPTFDSYNIILEVYTNINGCENRIIKLFFYILGTCRKYQR